MNLIADIANGFIYLFQTGGDIFLSWVTGIIPLIVVLMTAVNALIKIVGEEKVENFAKKMTRYAITRYTVLPVLSVIFVTSPMCFTFGRFLEEKYKPAFYDAAVSFVHPVTGLFPHANAGELFVWMGIATGVMQLGIPLGDLAVRYFLVGVIVIFLRGVITEKIYLYMLQSKKQEAANE